MRDQDKTREQLVAELAQMRRHIADLEGRLRSLAAAQPEREQTEETRRRAAELAVLNELAHSLGRASAAGCATTALA